MLRSISMSHLVYDIVVILGGVLLGALVMDSLRLMENNDTIS